MKVFFLLVCLAFLPTSGMSQPRFDVVETTIAEIHSAYASGLLTSRQLTQLYLDRIEAYDQQGPTINAVITLNADALQDADRDRRTSVPIPSDGSAEKKIGKTNEKCRLVQPIQFLPVGNTSLVPDSENI